MSDLHGTTYPPDKYNLLFHGTCWNYLLSTTRQFDGDYMERGPVVLYSQITQAVLQARQKAHHCASRPCLLAVDVRQLRESDDLARVSATKYHAQLLRPEEYVSMSSPMNMGTDELADFFGSVRSTIKRRLGLDFEPPVVATV
jgi:hypothetical protein